ncbi:MAG: four helix bundle protein [Acidobacteriota bacterium]
MYKAAIEFLASAARILDQYPKGYASLADQLRRASLSIPLNIAEGYGKRGPQDPNRYHDIARGSAHQCGALLDASRVLNLIDEETHIDGKTLLQRIVSMLVKMTSK